MISKNLQKRLINIGFFTLSTLVIVGGGFLALLSARGNVLTPNGVSGTGTIRVSVFPDSEIQVFLDEQQKTLSNNKTIDNVLPGEYQLRIQKEGFNAWEQRVNVREGLVSDISAQLFPTTIPITQLTTTGVQNFVTSKSGRVVYYVTNSSEIGSNVGIWRLNLQSGGLLGTSQSTTKISNITQEIKDSIDAGTYQLYPSPNDSRLLLVAASGIYLLDANRYNEPALANKLSFNYPLDLVSWLNDGSNLLIRSGNLLLDYNLTTNTSTLITYSLEAPVFAQINGNVYFMSSNRMFRYNQGTTSQVRLENVSLPVNISNIYSGDSENNLVLSADNRLYFLDITTSTLTSIGSFQLKSIAPNGRELILSNGNNIFISNISVSLVQNLVNISTRELGLKELEASLIKWAPNSVYFTFVDKADNSLKAASSYGTTVNTLFTQLAPTTTNSAFAVNSDSTYVILKVKDSNSEVNRDNLYRLDLE